MQSTSLREPKPELSENFQRQGSLRRVIPSQHNKENVFGKHSEDLNKLHKVFHQEYIILAEYNMVQRENIRGVYVIPSKENSLLWFGVVFVRGDIYEGGIFRFNIHLDEKFPDSAHPRVVFQSEIYHPLIDPISKELNLLGGFPSWNRGEQRIWQLLKYIHWFLHNFKSGLVHACNLEAVEMFNNDKELFMQKIQDCVTLSQQRLYDKPPVEDHHYISFDPYIPSIHDPVRATMLTQNLNEEQIFRGLSWVNPGSFRPLSKDPCDTNVNNDDRHLSS